MAASSPLFSLSRTNASFAVTSDTQFLQLAICHSRASRMASSDHDPFFIDSPREKSGPGIASFLFLDSRRMQEIAHRNVGRWRNGLSRLEEYLC
jgi:hypothetical protein